MAQVFETRAQWSRYALTQPEAVHDSQGGRFNTTELHCTEYFPAVRWGAFPAVCTVSAAALIGASHEACKRLPAVQAC